MVKKLINRVRKEGLCYILDRLMKHIVYIFTRKAPLKDIIVIESHNDFDCNGGAFYDYLLKKGINEKYKIVWLVKNPPPKQLPKNVYAFPIKKLSWRKNYYINTAKYLLADDYVTKKLRADQKSIYCTHGGCTLKNVKGFLVVPSSVDYVLSPSERYDPYMCENFSIPYPNNKMLHIGFPSDDILFQSDENEYKKITEKEYSKYILWMPTFRKGGGKGRNDSEIDLPMGIPLFETKEQLEQLNSRLKEHNCLLTIKIHPMQDMETVKDLKSLSNIIVLDGKTVKSLGVDNYRLMAFSDALISDYSSAAYSFLLLNRPLAFVLSDVAQYKLGLLMENYLDYMPGKWVYTAEDFIDFVSDVTGDVDKYASERLRLRSWFYEHTDSGGCKRLAQFMGLE